ncbi:hypothetical protein BHM03_00031382, partial [Ensete ventricosum]
LGIGLGSDDAVGPRREFARRFAEGIWKLAGNTLGDRWKKTIELTVRMPEAIELSGRQLSVDELPRSGSRDHRYKKGRLLMIEPIEESEEEGPKLEKEDTKKDPQLVVNMVHTLTGYKNPQTMKIEWFLE